MVLNCCIEPQRELKTRRIMSALATGTGGSLCFGEPPSLDDPFVVWGHRFLSETLIPKAVRAGTPWWFIDNGYYRPARGGLTGYYSLTYRGLVPVMLEDADPKRLRIDMAPWRRNADGHVLLALPGPYYGQMLGHDMARWSAQMRRKIRKYTTRRVVIRDKSSRRPLASDLAGAAVVVTHSSKVAVDAVVAGIPAVVAPTNPAAPVCSTDLHDIDAPKMPARERWWSSLMAQQFTLDEMRSGIAAEAMQKIRSVVDAG